jgi:large subunit ribosomal protein L7Ae
MPKGNTKTKTTTKAKKDLKYKSLFESTPRSFRIGGAIQPKRDVTRMVRWPQYILLQRQKRILMKRLKVPGVINQFTQTLTADKAKVLFKLLAKYKPETAAAKKARLQEAAKNADAKQPVDSKKPRFLKSGLNHVTTLVEQKKAKLVVIAHDVDPIELVLWLPHLCKSKNVPYVFIKGKARLGALVGKKTSSVVAITDLRKEDQAEFDRLSEYALTNYNNNKELATRHGAILLGGKAQARLKKTQEAKNAEIMQKN